MKNLLNFKWLLLSIVLSIASVNSLWAKWVYVDKSNLSGYGTPYIHYYGGTSDATVSTTQVEGDLYKLEIPDDATTWQVCRKDNGNYYNYLGGDGMDLSTYDVCYIVDWDKSYWAKYQTRTYTGGEKIYFKNFQPSGWKKYWCDDGLTCWIHFFNMATGASYDVKLSDNGGGIFEGTAGAGTYSDVILVRCSNASSIDWPSARSDNRSLAFSVGEDGSKNMIDDLSPGSWNTNYGGWTKYAKTPAVIGSMNGWNVEANPATSSRWSDSKEIKIIPVTLAAATDYTFRVISGQNEYGASDLTITGTTKDGTWVAYSTGDNKDVTITTDEAGEYVFQYNTSSNYVAVFYPKSKLKQNTYLYFDGSANTAWGAKDPYHAKFSYQYYDSHSEHSYIFCSNDTLKEDHIFYTMVPNESSIGRVQVMCMYTDHSAQHYYANSNDASERTSSAPNCLIAPAAGSDGITLTWGTYCPPMSAATLSDNSTTVISWTSGDGSDENPYLVKTGTSIKVTAGATTAIDDDNMTKQFDFKVNSTSEQDGTSSTFSYIASENNTLYTVTVDAYNYYNSTSGTKNTPTGKYYKALNTYSVGHSLSNISWGSGRTGTDAAAYSLDYTATLSPETGYNRPTTITVTAGETDITANCTWNSSTGAITIPGSYINGNLIITAAGVAKQCTVEFDKNDGDGGDDDVTATYASAMTTIAIPHKIGYAFDGYYDDEDFEGTKYYDANGSSANTWDKATEGTTTLYAKWTADNKTFKANAAPSAWETPGNWTGGAPSNDYSSVTINGDVVLSSSVHIGQMSFGDGGKLTISAGATLEVAGAITNSDESKILIESDAKGQGALILNNSSAAKATVKIYAKVLSHSSFQCVALPVTSASVSNSFAGSDVYTYVWHEGTGWERRGYYTDLSEFEGIALMQTGVHTYTVSGTLVSTSNITHTLNYSSGTYVGTNMFGNSWTAPIKIAAIEFADGAEQTVYICENGSWEGYPKGSAGENVIPALQAYTVLATKASSITVKYKETVRDAATHTDVLRAPKHNTTDEMSEVKLFVSDGERQTDLRLFENEQFTNAFDNGWEARYIEGDGLSGQLYAQTDDRMTVLASPDLEGTVVGFIPGESTNYTISFEGDGEGYYLNDVKKEESTLIAEGNTYEFSADEATNAARFVISKTPISKTPTSVDYLNDGVKARKQLIDGALYIIRDGRMYNAEGAIVK